jgi:hypothetical protein
MDGVRVSEWVSPQLPWRIRRESLAGAAVGKQGVPALGRLGRPEKGKF